MPSIFEGEVTITKLKLDTSLSSTSVAVRVVVIVPPSSPVPVTAAATGASFTGVTVIVNIWSEDAAGLPSSVTVSVTSPLVNTPSKGVQAIVPVPASIVISVGSLVNAQLSELPSSSVAVGAYVYSTSSVAVVSAVLIITGASLTELIVMVAEAVDSNPPESTAL